MVTRTDPRDLNNAAALLFSSVAEREATPVSCVHSFIDRCLWAVVEQAGKSIACCGVKICLLVSW